MSEPTTLELCAWAPPGLLPFRALKVQHTEPLVRVRPFVDEFEAATAANSTLLFTLVVHVETERVLGLEVLACAEGERIVTEMNRLLRRPYEVHFYATHLSKAAVTSSGSL